MRIFFHGKGARSYAATHIVYTVLHCGAQNVDSVNGGEHRARVHAESRKEHIECLESIL